MAKAKKKISGDAAGTPSAASVQPAPVSATAPQRDGSRQARRDLDDALRAAQAKEVEDASRRARAWLGAISVLKELLENNRWIEGKETFGVWIHPQAVRDYAKETGDSPDNARDWLQLAAESSLQRALEIAANRIVLFESDLRWPILATTGRIFGERALDDNAHIAVDDLGQTLKALRVLLEADRKLAQPDSSEPQDPLTPEQGGYLKLLHEQDEGEAISDEIAAKRIGYSDPSSIVDLRKVLREKGWNAIASKTGRGGGSSLDRSLLTQVQRDRLDAL